MLLQASTLEKLGLDEMTQKSTAIVRARVSGSFGAVHGQRIYTHYRVEVSETWKGSATGSLDVVVPGGTAAGLRQTISGAPKLVEGREYVLFLWTSPTGLTHIIGLSQGVFDIRTEASGELTAARPASSELMLDGAGNPVRDQAVRLRLKDLRTRVGRGAEGVRK